jgi:hypothetical protein
MKVLSLERKQALDGERGLSEKTGLRQG